MKEKVNILGLYFDNITKVRLLDELKNRLENKKKTFLVTSNPEIVMFAQKNEEYKKTLERADYIIADGIGVIYGSRIIKNALPERIPGFDLMVDLLKLANEKNLRVYFLGAKQETLDLVLQNVKRDYPKLNIAGSHNGYFDIDNHEVAHNVKIAQADLIFVALGFPKQEKWIEKNIEQADKGLFIGVGGSFDVLAGTVKRAPLIWQKLNVEWLYRLLRQPSRWKRMLALPYFIIKMISKR